ncbi:MAG: glycosyltransferase [Pedobacter sp.]|jgi:glycosyltransferase involved in cell wall biosynthesis|uniref:glycosyltransferase n=1 Tax=Pedobacter sp. TaxID=1411316 RepID=UPI003567D220
MTKKDITFLIPSMNGGGAEKVTMLIANELCARGWMVTLLMSKLEGPYLDRLDRDIKIELLKKRNISKNLLEITAYLRKNKPTIFYSSMMYVNVIAGLAAKLAGYKGKLYFSEHSHVSTSIATNKGLTFKVIFTLAKLLYKDPNAIVCVSEGVKEDLTSIIKKIKRTIVINNPVENLFMPIERRSDDKYRLISIGRLDRDKNFKLLIEAFAEVLKEVDNSDTYELYILGEGYERKNLENLISSLNLSTKVFLPGFVNSPREMLNSSDLFVFPSVREGFGNVLVEALSCGLPVIAADCKSGPAEILLNGKVGVLVPIHDKEKLKMAIIDEITSPNQTSSKETRMERANDFSIHAIVNKYENLFLNKK